MEHPNLLLLIPIVYHAELWYFPFFFWEWCETRENHALIYSRGPIIVFIMSLLFKYTSLFSACRGNLNVLGGTFQA